MRHRTAELTTATSFYSDSSAAIWLNLAQFRIVKLGGYIPKFTDIVYTEDSNFYALPTDFRQVTGAEIMSRGIWYPVAVVDNFTADPISQVKISWVNEDSAIVLTNRTGFEERMLDILYSVDSVSYVIPQDFKSILSVMLRKGGKWEPVFLNLGFMSDTNAYNYTIFQENTNIAHIYIKGDDLWDNDTIRVFYRRTLQDNDTLRVDYVGTASEMLTPAAICQVPDELHNFIIDEAISYYMWAQKRFQEAALLQQRIRVDMGIVQQ